MATKTRPKGLPLDNESAKIVTDNLQGTLVDLKALSLVTKQLHWNIRGPHFKPIHEHLDLVYEACEEGADEVAERIATLGVSPNAQPTDLVTTTVKEVEKSTFIEDQQVLEDIVERLANATHDIRDKMEAIEEPDPATADLLHQIILTLEKHLWMLRSHIVRGRGDVVKE
jgi:starvation-inducible DNA-binding protein